MSQLPKFFITITTTASLLLGCSAAQTDAPVTTALRSGPALTDTALAGMYMSRTSDDPASVKFVECLDNFVLRFDKDAEVSAIFSDMAAETDTLIQAGNVAYFTDQSSPERYKRLVDRMIKIGSQTENDIFNFDASSACVLSPEACTLPDEDANIVRLYWTTIEHGSIGCFE